ncbi:MAG: phage minor capsid protein [Bacillota bacterium]|nr:phage minor capsid protein [Bacillota bacterium]
MSNKSLQEIQALINIYQKAKQGLIRTIAEKEARGNVTWYKRSLLDQVERQLKHLSEQSEKWIKETLPFVYQESINNVNSILMKSGFKVDINKASFAKLHTKAIDSLILDTLDDLSEANKYAGDQIKHIVNDAVAQKLAQGQTVKECKKAIISELMEKGIDGVESKNGRMMSLDAYASTVARSRTREATNTAMINQLTALGRDLVKVSSHNSSCPICAAYEGRVFSISGKDTRYPPLSVAFSGIYANIHPNCSHVLLPYIEELADDPEADRINSNLPFSIDPRSRKEVDIYNEVRKKKQRLREDRRQWERYTLAFPDDTPKTFQTFCSMKRSNNSKWQKLQQQYKDYIKDSDS